MNLDWLNGLQSRDKKDGSLTPRDYTIRFKGLRCLELFRP